MFGFNLRTIQSRIIALGMLMLIVALVVRLLTILPFVQKHLSNLVAEQQLSIATYVARNVDQHIVARQTLIGALATDLPTEWLAQPARLRAWAKDRQSINPMFDMGLIVVRPDGKGLLAEFPVIGEREFVDYAEADWFHAALAGTAAVIGRPMRAEGGAAQLVMATALRDAAGQIIGVLAGVASLKAPHFLDLLQETRLGVSGGFMLVSPADKLFVVATDSELILQATPPAGANVLLDQAIEGFRGTGVTVGSKGEEELVAIASVPSSAWFVVAYMPVTEAYRPVDALREFILRNSIVVMALLLAFLLVVLPRLLRPLREAAAAIGAMGEGRRDLAPLPVGRDDEVGHLVAGFNTLVNRLQEREAVLKASEARLEFLAYHDPLTGLPNRALFEDRLEQMLARTRRDATEMALLFCDLDGFKPINDAHGHGVGDAVLREVAERLGTGRRRTDTVARLGGDEFVILLSDLHGAREVAIAVAEGCLAAISRPFEVEGQTLVLGLSIGIALHHGASGNAPRLLSQADQAMYQAKGAGKGQYRFFDAEA